MNDLFMRKSADISPCGKYRYILSRQWTQNHEPSLIFIMLNPSTADANEDDPTIRRCMAFAKREGFGGIQVFNLFGFRATDPKSLPAEGAVGPMNGHYHGWAFQWALHAGAKIVAAWGAHPHPEKNEAIQSIVNLAKDFGVSLYCLGTTQAGQPRHPLYIKGDQPLVPFSALSAGRET